jgi:hypothetical protein
MGEIERTLLLCMAYPELSERYEATVCMAGITEEGNFRRIYPVPFDEFVDADFEKRRWMEYEIREKGDYREESYKIYPESVEIGNKVDYVNVRDILEERCTTIEELEQEKQEEDRSLGIVKPEVNGLNIDEDENRRDTAEKCEQQVTLSGEDVIQFDIIPHYVRYRFNCAGQCNICENSPHNIMCEDIESGNLYRNLSDEYDDESVVEEKMEEKLLDWMVEERDLYFMMGTHHRWKTWLIISLLYPPKRENNKLTDTWE